LEDSQGNRLAIVTMDLIGVDRLLRDWLVKRVQEKHGLAPAGLLLNVSHTHCGPVISPDDFPATLDDAAAKADAVKYRRELQEKLAAVVGEAIGRMAPAQLDYLHARCGFAMNRRRPTPRGFQNAANTGRPRGLGGRLLERRVRLLAVATGLERRRI
jgi:neutral ceramidase